MFLESNFINYADWILLLLIFLSFGQQLFYKRFNIYGIISLISLSIYISIHSLHSGINTLALILFISSIFLIILEMFIPGGIIGTIGIISLLIALVVVNDSTKQITFIIVGSILSLIVLYLINIYIFKKRLLFLNNFVLDDKISTEKGYVAMESDDSLIGKDLIAFTDLRPSGTAICNDKKYDVVTEGEFIVKGSNVVITEVKGMRIVVRKK